MGVPKTPRTGNKSAPTSAPDPHPTTFGPTSKSAPTSAPAVRSTTAPKANGDPYTPTSVKSATVDQIAPKPGSKDPHIEGIV